MIKYFISTGEVSGEMHAAYIVQEIKKNNENIEIYASGGEKLRKAGAEIVEDIENIAVMGLTEVVGKIYYLKKKADEYINMINEKKIENVILVDYGGFNLYFLKRLKKETPKVKVFYYIPPKLWAWGKGRLKSLKLADSIIVIFPWEREFYKKNNVDAVYFGNPLVDVIKKIEKSGNNILMLPGSRNNEIKSLMPIFVSLADKNPDKKFLIKCATEKQRETIRKYIINNKNISIMDRGITLQAAAELSKAAVAASGTVTLELALLGIPTVVCYKFSVVTEFIAKIFLKIKYISLPNIILDKPLFAELLQKNLSLENLQIEIDKALEINTDKDFRDIRDKLGGENIIGKYAEYILKESKN